MKSKKPKIPPEIQTAIAAALGQYLKDDQLDFQVVSARPVQQSKINIWGLFGRQEIMTGYRRK